MVGALSVVWSFYWLAESLELFSLGHVGVLLGLFVLMLLAIPLCFGLGCLYLARRLHQGDRVARVLAVALCVSAAVAFLLTGARDTALVLAALGCLGVAALLSFDPVVRAHFTRAALHGHEPAPVVAARTLLVLVAGCDFLVGVMFLPLADVEGRLAFYGLLYLGIGVALLNLSRALSRGSSSARVTVTLLAAVYFFVALLAGHGQPGVILPIGLACFIVGLLWLPASARTYFAARPRPVQPFLAGVERGIDQGIAAVVTAFTPGAASPGAAGTPPPATPLADQAPPAPSATRVGEPAWPAAPAAGPTPPTLSIPVPEAPPPEPPLANPAPPDLPGAEQDWWDPPPPAAPAATESWAEQEDRPASPSLPGLASPEPGWSASPQDGWPGDFPRGRLLTDRPAAGYAWVALAASVVLGLDLVLPSFIRVPAPSPKWQLSALHVDILGFRAAGQLHRYPTTLWMLAVCLAGATAALIASLAALPSRGERTGWAITVGGVVSAIAGIVTTQLSQFDGAPGPGAWGALAAGLVVAMAGLALALGDIRPRKGLSIFAAAGVCCLLVAWFPVFQHHDTTVELNTAPPADTTPKVTTAPAPEAPAEPLQHTYAFTETEQGGYRFSGTLELGAPEHVTDGLTEGTLQAGSACDVDAQTDAVVPGYLSVTNSTNRFDAQVAVTLSWTSGVISGIEMGYSDGPTCDGPDGANGSSSAGLQSNDSLAPGGEVSADLFVVISDYYSPDHPNGDRAVLRQAQLSLAESTDDAGDTILPSSLSGPSVSGNGDGSAIPLGG